jgi:hypothetical protein
VIGFRPAPLYLWGKVSCIRRIGGWQNGWDPEPVLTVWRREKKIVKVEHVRVDGIHLAQDKDEWHNFVNNVISIRSGSPA